MNEEKRALVNQVIGQLQTVIDPELLVNVVDLGLIYGVDIDDEGNCLVTMTLTTAGCPLNDYLNREIRQAVGQLDAIKQVDIKLVWYPVWTPDRLSEQAKKQLGIKKEPAPAAKEINLHQPIKTFADQYPEFTEDMAEIGFNRIKIPGMLDTVGRLMTLPMGCRAMGFDLEEVKEKLRLKGYEVTE